MCLLTVLVATVLFLWLKKVQATTFILQQVIWANLKSIFLVLCNSSWGDGDTRLLTLDRKLTEQSRYTVKAHLGELMSVLRFLSELWVRTYLQEHGKLKDNNIPRIPPQKG